MVLFSAGCETRAGGCNQPYLLCIELIHSGLYLLSSWPFTYTFIFHGFRKMFKVTENTLEIAASEVLRGDQIAAVFEC